MATRTAILKHVSVTIRWTDDSFSGLEFESTKQAQEYLSTLDLHSTYSVTVMPIWSKPGETVALKVHNGWD